MATLTTILLASLAPFLGLFSPQKRFPVLLHLLRVFRTVRLRACTSPEHHCSSCLLRLLTNLLRALNSEGNVLSSSFLIAEPVNRTKDTRPAFEFCAPPTIHLVECFRSTLTFP
ncbi:hypothetical protein BDN67DRAFT_963397, partial [Paxillus ammoniavirescens]